MTRGGDALCNGDVDIMITTRLSTRINGEKLMESDRKTFLIRLGNSVLAEGSHPPRCWAGDVSI